MKNSTQFSLAVHTLLMVAHFPERHITSPIVAVSAGCHPVVIRNLFIKLKEAGLLITKPGRGKTELGRPPETITLWDIFTAVEGEQALEPFKIHTAPLGLCPVGASVRTVLRSHMDSAAQAMRQELAGATLADLLAELKTLSLPEGTEKAEP